jgi:hypothetical protein
MTSFDLVRAGWPNLVTLLALAALPLVALATPPAPAPAAVAMEIAAPLAVAELAAE